MTSHKRLTVHCSTSELGELFSAIDDQSQNLPQWRHLEVLHSGVDDQTDRYL